ncbi:MAG TPA: hypothetical protein VHP58_02615 [Alphaproteobacteria bacterium]|nr:hypothetical protein [Alphaproteobacteria bacterium]
MIRPIVKEAEGLEALGLTVEPFHQSLFKGHSDRLAFSNPNDAVFMPPLVQWNGTLSGLRTHLAPFGWTKLTDQGYDLVVDATGKLAIAVSSGDDNTGIDGLFPPTTKCAKGPRTIDAVQTNAMLMDNLFPETLPHPSVMHKKGRLTRLLLFSQRGGVIYSELSLPSSTDGSKIDSWQERIILPPMDLGAIPTQPETPDDTPDVLVDVRRKKL